MREHQPQYKIAGWLDSALCYVYFHLNSILPGSRSWRSAGFNILFAQAEVMPFFSKTVEARITAA